MNKFFLIIILLLIQVSSYTQKCNYEVNKIDEESQLIVKRTIDVTLCKLNGHPFLFKSQQIGERKYLKLRYYLYHNFSIIEGSKLIFYFPNGDKLMLNPLEFNKNPNSKTNSMATVSKLVVYELSKEEFNILLTNPVNMIAVYTNTGITKKEIKGNQQNEIQNLLECIN
jgi:hypothetical protein